MDWQLFAGLAVPWQWLKAFGRQVFCWEGTVVVNMGVSKNRGTRKTPKIDVFVFFLENPIKWISYCLNLNFEVHRFLPLKSRGRRPFHPC